MASIRFNCVVNGKRTSTSINEDLVRFYACAVEEFNLGCFVEPYIQKNATGEYVRDVKYPKKLVQDFINGLYGLKNTDDIEYKMLKRILYVSPKK